MALIEGFSITIRIGARHWLWMLSCAHSPHTTAEATPLPSRAWVVPSICSCTTLSSAKMRLLRMPSFPQQATFATSYCLRYLDNLNAVVATKLMMIKGPLFRVFFQKLSSLQGSKYSWDCHSQEGTGLDDHYIIAHSTHAHLASSLHHIQQHDVEMAFGECPPSPRRGPPD
ncbi:hypothetical protein LCI18_000937 [Fusarium solani-melongenae]|uniref:Uncharacterized protein n=1 Tax=Fusarium solani subsp. cucurbitae TaxID=2747967 RepID=A0ACD3YLX6_FUSSC|nr:hypothetical protein LCI18_000937 [Fusarium solani-melongenae]